MYKAIDLPERHSIDSAQWLQKPAYVDGLLIQKYNAYQTSTHIGMVSGQAEQNDRLRQRSLLSSFCLPQQRLPADPIPHSSLLTLDTCHMVLLLQINILLCMLSTLMLSSNRTARTASSISCAHSSEAVTGLCSFWNVMGMPQAKTGKGNIFTGSF